MLTNKLQNDRLFKVEQKNKQYKYNHDSMTFFRKNIYCIYFLITFASTSNEQRLFTFIIITTYFKVQGTNFQRNNMTRDLKV